MNRQSSINLALFLIIILLAGFLILIPERNAIDDFPMVTKISTVKINQIVIEHHNKHPIKFIKRNNMWMLTEPVEIAANPARINAILSLLQAESYSQLDIMDTDLSSLGLHTPDVILHLNNHTFEFGGTDAIDQRRYVRYGQEIHLAHDTLYHQLQQDYAFFVDRKLLPENIQPVKIALPVYTLEFLDGDWTLSPPGEMPKEKITRTVNAWRAAIATNVNSYQDEENRSVAVITSEHKDIISFDIRDTPEVFILARPDLGIQYQLSRKLALELLLLKE